MKSWITHDRKILGGKPIIKGTRMSVGSILELLASGMKIKDILKEYPFLKKEQVEEIKKEYTIVSNRKELQAHLDSLKKSNG